MFIECAECNSKYLVNSADLKPNGRMVECANCNHKWFQEATEQDELLSKSVPSSDLDEKNYNINSNPNDLKSKSAGEIKNLPSTIVNEQKVSTFNSLLVILVLFFSILLFLLIRSYGVNIFVLINYYIHEFYFNLRLIINDIAMIIHQIIN